MQNRGDLLSASQGKSTFWILSLMTAIRVSILQHCSEHLVRRNEANRTPTISVLYDRPRMLELIHGYLAKVDPEIRYDSIRREHNLSHQTDYIPAPKLHKTTPCFHCVCHSSQYLVVQFCHCLLLLFVQFLRVCTRLAYTQASS